jgi:hypothetical protein
MESGFFAEKWFWPWPQNGPVFPRRHVPYIRQCPVLAALVLAGALACLLTGPSAVAQPQIRSIAELPDAPVPKSDSPGAQQDTQRPKRGGVVGLLSRRSVFFPELAYQKGPLSSGQKLALAADVSIAPSRIISSAFIAGIDQATNSPSGYGQGGEGYGKRFGAAMATSASENMFGTFLLPTIFRQDPRYFPRPNLSFKQRVGYALRRVVVTRTDSGGEAFNVSGILGTLMAESLANSYLPDAERTAGRTFQRSGIRIGLNAASSILKEYWPNIFKSLGMRKVAQSTSRQSDLGATPKP